MSAATSERASGRASKRGSARMRTEWYGGGGCGGSGGERASGQTSERAGGRHRAIRRRSAFAGRRECATLLANSAKFRTASVGLNGGGDSARNRKKLYFNFFSYRIRSTIVYKIEACENCARQLDGGLSARLFFVAVFMVVTAVVAAVVAVLSSWTIVVVAGQFDEKLRAAQVAINAGPRDELVVRAAFDNAAIVDDGDDVGVLDGGETMRDHETRAAVSRLVERVLNEPLTLGIERACRLVEQQDARIANESARDRNSLQRRQFARSLCHGSPVFGRRSARRGEAN